VTLFDHQGTRVAIVGAGISGLTLALALERAGIPHRVFEQAPVLGEVGAGVQLAPNATRVLEALGLGERLRAVAVRPEAIEMRRWNDGRVLGRTPLGDECEKAYGAPYYALYRPDLQQCLLSALAPGTVELGRRCVGLTADGCGVALQFADGSGYDADVCVGADGIHSAVRESLATDSPRSSGQSMYRGTIPIERVPFLAAEPKVVLWLGPRRHLVHYPVAAGRLVSFAATSPAEDWISESWSATADPGEVADAYAGWHPGVTQVLAAIGGVNRWALHDRDATGPWHSGQVVLIGDAAHPMLPFVAQGANQAIEDAAVLAACLDGTAQASLALERYEAARRDRVARVHEVSRGNATRLHLDDADRERDAGLRAAQQLTDQQWLFEYNALGAVPAHEGTAGRGSRS